MKANKYPAGYLPKIQYWTNEYYTNLIAGITHYSNGDKMAGAAYDTMAAEAVKKLNYFQQKHSEQINTMAQLN